MEIDNKFNVFTEHYICVCEGIEKKCQNLSFLTNYCMAQKYLSFYVSEKYGNNLVVAINFTNSYIQLVLFKRNIKNIKEIIDVAVMLFSCIFDSTENDIIVKIVFSYFTSIHQRNSICDNLKTFGFTKVTPVGYDSFRIVISTSKE